MAPLAPAPLAMAPLAMPIPACTPTEGDSVALPESDRAPVIHTLLPSWLSEALFSLKPAAAWATVVLARLTVPASSLPLM